MSAESLAALVALAVATLFTPGPNNAMLAASGASFGFRRTVPHLLGVAIGFSGMLLVVGLFLGQVFQASPVLREGLRWGGAAILLWMAWKIGTSGSVSRKTGEARPMTFAGAAAFQWINPKAWPMAIAATAQFVHPSEPLATATFVTAVFLALGFVSSATWVMAGQAIARWLTSEARLRAFNVAMALLIALSVLELVRH
jgi:threonine/homoserine/homoserine lactone efflux protein